MTIENLENSIIKIIEKDNFNDKFNLINKIYQFFKPIRNIVEHKEMVDFNFANRNYYDYISFGEYQYNKFVFLNRNPNKNDGQYYILFIYIHSDFYQPYYAHGYIDFVHKKYVNIDLDERILIKLKNYIKKPLKKVDLQNIFCIFETDFEQLDLFAKE